LADPGIVEKYFMYNKYDHQDPKVILQALMPKKSIGNTIGSIKNAGFIIVTKNSSPLSALCSLS
jgi:hypothetical protein